MTGHINKVSRTWRGRMTAAMILVLLTPAISPAQETSGLAAPVGDSQVFTLRYTATFAEDQLVFGNLLGYDTLRLKSGGCLNEPGQPMLPAHTLRMALPAGMTATGVRVAKTQALQLAGQYSLFPAQPPRRVSDGASAADFVAPDPRIYESPEPYPAELVELTHQTDLAGQGIALVRLYPVRYVPTEKTLTLYRSIEIVIEGVGGYECGDYLPDQVSARGRAAYEQTIADMVVNPEAVELRTSGEPPPPSRGVGPGSYGYVIITSSDWVDDFQPLADWKTRKGTSANIVTTSWIYNSGGYSGSDQDKIRAFVQDAHSTWGATYFLLGGDTDTVPCDSTTFSSVDPEAVPNDTYYADYDGDWTCEVHVGRASVRSASAVSTFINKVLTYEKNPPLTDYAKTIAFFGFDLDEYTAGEDTKIDIESLYVPSSWTYRSEYDSESGSHKSDVIGYMNQGNHLQNLIDHCNESVMGVGYVNHDDLLSTSDIDDLYNGDRQIIFYTLGCWPCAFDYTSCIAEHLVRDTDGGGMAFVGNTRYGWYYQGYDDYLSARFDRYFFRSLFSQGHYVLGECFSDHKNDSYENEDIYQYIFTELTLLGDPELPIWTEDPQSLDLSHASTLNVGEYTTFPVTVTSGGSPIDSATVCLWKDGDVYEVTQTNTSGIASFGFTPGSAGTMYVTASKHNYLPEESSAEVTAGTVYTLTVNVTGSGSVDLDPPGGSYAPDTTVQLTANPNADWRFDHWEDDLSGSTNPDTIVMDSDKTVTAVFVEDLAPLIISFPSGLPEYLEPDVATAFDVQIEDGDEAYVPGTGTLHYRYDGGTYLTSALAHVSGNLYEATLPAATCSDTPEFYISAAGDGGSTVYSPEDAPTSVYTAIVGALTTILDDNFETNQGWTAVNAGASSGDWQRGVPVNDPSWDYDPTSDSDGSGQCYLTQNELGNTDVDDGAVQLISPTLDLSGGNVTISYDYYLYLTNTDGSDRLLVEIDGNDGAGPWVEIARHDTHGGLSWRSHVIEQADLDTAGVTLTSTMKLRFTANDADPQSINESGLDAVLITAFACQEEEEYTLTVNVTGSGSVTKNPDQATYTYGTPVELTATADPGWYFDHWEGDLTGSTNPDTIVMDANKTVTAIFVQEQYTLTVNITGNGSVTRNPDQATYTYGTPVELTANADPGWYFDHWEGDLTGSTNPDTIVMDGNKTVTAVFVQEQYTLTVNITGSGSVAKNPDQATYTYGQNVQLTANADTGWHFDHWEGDLTGSSNPDTIVMDGDKTVTAVFVQEQYTLTVNITGSGSVAKNPDQATYTYGTPVELTASADAGWYFDHWEGDLTGSTNPDTIVMDSDKTVTAVFIAITDCNSNGVDDSEDIANGTSQDCNGNGVPDECDIWDVTSEDCNDNGVPDECEEDSRDGLAGTYYDDDNFTGTLRGRVDQIIDFDWGSGEPWPGYGADNFTIRWTGFVQTPGVSGTYTFYTTTDDGVRLWVANQLIIDRWIDQSPTEWSGTIELEANSEYPIKMEYYENGGGAVAELRWQPPGQSKVVIPAANLIPGRDCNTNGVPDDCDLASGYSDDVNGNGIPDECDPQFTLTINTVGQGSVTLDPPGGTYLDGTEVTLTANADTGWTFDHWQGDLTGSDNPATVTMGNDLNITAVFVQDEYTLTINLTGSGSVTKDPDQPTYTYGQSVELTATPDIGWYFDHWEGDLTGSTNPDTIVMDGDKTVTAVFVQDEYTLTINLTGSGSVTKDPDQPTYTYGQSVELTATPDIGWYFDHWEGDLTGSTNPDTIVMDGDKTVTAVFVQDEYTLTINLTGSGSVTKDPDQPTYTYGQSVELTATPDIGWYFDHWEGDLTGSTNPDTIVMDGDKTVTAVFEADCYGDLNADGRVNISDLAIMLSNYGMTGGATYQEGDLNGDGDINISDLADLLSVYGTVCW